MKLVEATDDKGDVAEENQVRCEIGPASVGFERL